MRVLAIDDHVIVRDGLRSIFEEHGELTQFGEASSFEEALQLLRNQQWDLVVLDIAINGRSGLEILKEIRVHDPRVPVLVLSMHTEEQYAVRAFRAGASGYVTKGSSRRELVEAATKVLRGGRYASPSIAEGLLGRFERGEAEPHELLSDREFEVMRLIASGKTVGEIAAILALSEKTVSTYRTRILSKMRLKSSAALMSYAMQAGLIR